MKRFTFGCKRTVLGQIPVHDRREEPSTLFPLPILPASFAMSYSTSEEAYYKRHSLALASTQSFDDSPDKERASIWSLSTVDEDPNYPRPTRLYQCALVISGFMATFQTIGANQTYGIFQVSASASLSHCGNISMDFYMNDTLNRNTIHHREARSLMVPVSMHWPRSLAR